MDVAHPLFSGKLEREVVRLVEHLAVLDDGRAQVLHRLKFPGIGPFRHDDRHRGAEGRPGERDRLAMVAGGRGYESAGELVRVKL